MKKVLAILLVLVVAMTGVMAEAEGTAPGAPATVKLQSTVVSTAAKITLWYDTQEIVDGSAVTGLTLTESGNVILKIKYSGNPGANGWGKFDVKFSPESFINAADSSLKHDVSVVVEKDAGAGGDFFLNVLSSSGDDAVYDTLQLVTPHRNVASASQIGTATFAWDGDADLAAGNYTSIVTIAVTSAS